MKDLKIKCTTDGEFRLVLDGVSLSKNRNIETKKPAGHYIMSWVVFGEPGTEYKIDCIGASMKPNPIEKKIPSGGNKRKHGGTRIIKVSREGQK